MLPSFSTGFSHIPFNSTPTTPFQTPTQPVPFNPSHLSSNHYTPFAFPADSYSTISSTSHSSGSLSPGPSTWRASPADHSVTPVPYPTTLSPFAEPHSAAKLLERYRDGSLLACQSEKGWKLQCCVCCDWVQTGIPNSVASLYSEGHFASLASHCRGGRCNIPKPIHQNVGRTQQTRFPSSSQSSRVCTPLAPMNLLPALSSATFNQTQPGFDHVSGTENEETIFEEYSRSPSFHPGVDSGMNPLTCRVYDLPRSHNTCPGVRIEWRHPTGTVNETFPWSRIKNAGDPNAVPILVEVTEYGKVMTGWATSCLGRKGIGDFSCSECKAVPSRIQELFNLAVHAPAHTNYGLLNATQRTERLRETRSQLQESKLNALMLSRKLNSAFERLDDHSRILMTLAEGHIPRCQQLFEQALKQGVSVSNIVNKLRDALDGLYTPNLVYADDRAFDIALLSYRIGGRSLLYSLNHGLGLPSLRTLNREFNFVRIMPTIGRVSPNEILFNIKEVVLSTRERAGIRMRRGVSVMMDEIALEEMTMYFKHSNKVGGTCWLHSDAVDLSLDSYEAAENISSAILEDRIHMAKEMSVVSVACFGEEGATYPILGAPTCKHEVAQDAEDIFDMVLGGWRESGAGDVVGEIWSFATDGDGVRRLAGHKKFLNRDLERTSPLFPTLSNMPGLNLRVGSGDITLDFDYKHLFKRFCTLVRQPGGYTLENGRVINANFITQYLIHVLGMDETTVTNLIYTDDSQDVPRAVELMQAIIALSRVDRSQYSSDVELVGSLDALALLSEMFDSLLQPFINIDLSLSEQVRLLSKYAHLAFSLFRCYRLHTMSNQLYGDSQTMVKNLMFCIAKQQRLNGSSRLFPFQLGTDRLERFFARMRMLGKHDSGMNYQQGVDRMGHGVDINAVLARNRDLDPGHRRLNLNRTEGADHIHIAAWKGDLVAQHCHLPSSWMEGQRMAVEILQKSKIGAGHYDFTTLFSVDSGVDLLRPFGDGIYPGIATDKDHSVPEQTSEPITNVESPKDDDIDLDVEATEAETTEAGGPPFVRDLSFEQAVDDQVDSPELDLPRQNTANSPLRQTSTIPAGPILSSDAHNSLAFNTSGSIPPFPRASGLDPNDYVYYKGRWIHKQSLCRIVINRAIQYKHKSFNRPERVIGFSKINKKKTLLHGNLLDPEAFIIGDLVLTLLRTTRVLSLAMIRCTKLEQSGQSRISVHKPTLMSPKGNIRVTGQLLRLIPISSPMPDENLVENANGIYTTAENTNSNLAELDAWVWSGAFETLPCTMRGTSTQTEKPLLLTLPGYLIQPINPPVFDITSLGNTNSPGFSAVNSAGKTWKLDLSVAELAIDLLWEMVKSTKTEIGAIPHIELPTAFPYKDLHGSPAFICTEGTAILMNKFAALEAVCRFCGAHVPHSEWRSHNGRHILFYSLSCPENPPLKQSIQANPCGWCARSGRPECTISMRESSRVQIQCACPFMPPNFRYTYAEKGTKSTHCRNVPIICDLCPNPPGRNPSRTAIWRYNMEEHLREEHPEYLSPRNPGGVSFLPQSLWKKIAITNDELSKSGLPDSHYPPPFTALENDDSPNGTTSRTTSKRRRTNTESSGNPSRRARRD